MYGVLQRVVGGRTIKKWAKYNYIVAKPHGNIRGKRATEPVRELN